MKQTVKQEDPFSLEIHPDNPRSGDVGAIIGSIKKNGWYGTIVAQRVTRRILAGNHRVLAARALQMEKVPVAWIDVDDATARRIVLSDNRTSDLATYDNDALSAFLDAIVQEEGLDGLEGTGYSEEDFDSILKSLEPPEPPPIQAGGLVNQFVVPPFTVLDARQGYWLTRKRQWLALGIAGEEGRDAPCLPSSITEDKGYKGKTNMPETSVFDPVLCEIAYRWFCTPLRS